MFSVDGLILTPPLLVAVSQGNPEMVLLLLISGANKTLQNLAQLDPTQLQLSDDVRNAFHLHERKDYDDMFFTYPSLKGLDPRTKLAGRSNPMLKRPSNFVITDVSFPFITGASHLTTMRFFFHLAVCTQW